MPARLALLALLLAGAGGGALLLTAPQEPAAPADAAAAQPAPLPACRPQIDRAWGLARALPPEDLSRRYAESDLNLAAIEEKGGEIDECQELVERAVNTVRTHLYASPPGETLDTSRPMRAAADGRG